MENAPVKLGDILAGKCRVERVLGQGAMGVVVAARHLDIDRLVALKFILPQHGAADEQAARFLREAKAASLLKSEHAGKVLDVGKLDDGRPYIVMELLDGKDLAHLLQEHGPFSVEDALTYTLHAAHAIAEAHTMGIIHRDLKPANLFRTSGPADEDIVKVLDFGISKLQNEATSLTGTGAMLGSPLYMSPEQYRGSRDVDPRSDVWALGVILYELLAGVTPFAAPTFAAVMTRVLFEPPVPLEQHRPELPRGLVAVIMQAFEKDVSRRYPSVSRFVAALAPYVPPSAAIYVKHIAEIQSDKTAPARPTVELVTETGTAAAASAPLQTGTAAAASAPLPSVSTVASTTPPGVSFRTLMAIFAGTIVLVLATVYGVLMWAFRPAPMPFDAGVAPTRSAEPAVPPAHVPSATTTPSESAAPLPIVVPASSPSAPAPTVPTPARTPAPKASPTPRAGPAATVPSGVYDGPRR